VYFRMPDVKGQLGLSYVKEGGLSRVGWGYVGAAMFIDRTSCHQTLRRRP